MRWRFIFEWLNVTFEIRGGVASQGPPKRAPAAMKLMSLWSLRNETNTRRRGHWARWHTTGEPAAPSPGARGSCAHACPQVQRWHAICPPGFVPRQRKKKKKGRRSDCFAPLFAMSMTLKIAHIFNMPSADRKKKFFSFSWQIQLNEWWRVSFFCVADSSKVCSARPHTLSSQRKTVASSLWHLPLRRDIFRVPVKINHDRAHPHKTLSNSHWLLSAVQAVKWSLAKGSWTTLNNQSEATTAPHCTPVLPLHYTQTIIQVDTSDT